MLCGKQTASSPVTERPVCVQTLWSLSYTHSPINTHTHTNHVNLGKSEWLKWEITLVFIRQRRTQQCGNGQVCIKGLFKTLKHPFTTLGMGDLIHEFCFCHSKYLLRAKQTKQRGQNTGPMYAIYFYCNWHQAHTCWNELDLQSFQLFTFSLERYKFVNANSLYSVCTPTYSVNKAIVWFFESVKCQGVQIQ